MAASCAHTVYSGPTSSSPPPPARRTLLRRCSCPPLCYGFLFSTCDARSSRSACATALADSRWITATLPRARAGSARPAPRSPCRCVWWAAADDCACACCCSSTTPMWATMSCAMRPATWTRPSSPRDATRSGATRVLRFSSSSVTKQEGATAARNAAAPPPPFGHIVARLYAPRFLKTELPLPTPRAPQSSVDDDDDGEDGEDGGVPLSSKLLVNDIMYSVTVHAQLGTQSGHNNLSSPQSKHRATSFLLPPPCVVVRASSDVLCRP